VRSALSDVDGVEDMRFEGKTATVFVTKDAQEAAIAALKEAGYKPKVE